MKILCPQCQTSYDIAPSALGVDGRQVRCVRCKAVWLAETPKLATNVIPLPAHDLRAAPLHGVVRAAAAESPAAAPAADVPADIAAADPEPAAAAPADSGVPNADPGAAVPETADAGDPPSDVPAESIAATAAAADTEEPPAASDPAGGSAEIDGATAASPAQEPSAPNEPSEPDAAQQPVFDPPVDYETLAARRTGPRRVGKRRPPTKSWRRRGLAAAIVGLIVLDAGLIVGRADVVRALPQTASLYESIGLPVNLRKLAFEDIKTTPEVHDGVKILVIEGTIVATGRVATDVPRLRFSIAAGNGHEIYAWTALPTRTRLAAGEALPFRTRLASPPEQGRSVSIRFFTRLDLATGLR